jgi:hypothetical protein
MSAAGAKVIRRPVVTLVRSWRLPTEAVAGGRSVPESDRLGAKRRSSDRLILLTFKAGTIPTMRKFGLSWRVPLDGSLRGMNKAFWGSR